MFGLCCAYGMIMFSDDFHKQHGALGASKGGVLKRLRGLLEGGNSEVLGLL